MTSIFTVSISHFCHSVFSLFFFFFFFFVGRLHGSWVVQLVGLAIGFGGFLIRVTVVSGECWWFLADMAGFFAVIVRRLRVCDFGYLPPLLKLLNHGEMQSDLELASPFLLLLLLLSLSLSLSLSFSFFSTFLLFLHFRSSEVYYFFANEMMNISF